ncbi:MAG: PRC-barrel domain-containing protein [Christensenellales bacterium]
MITSYSTLQDKQVINSCDGAFLGFICDLEIDLSCGQIKAIVIPGPSRFFGLLRPERDIHIPWNKICKIGRDVILVDADENLTRKSVD